MKKVLRLTVQMVIMVELIPIWFYLITSVIYSSSAIIGFLVSYFAFRAYRMTKNKVHLFLFLGFLILSLGFAILSATSIYIYTTLEIYKSSSVSLNLLNYQGFRSYYILSSIGYVLLTLMYLPKKVMNKLFILYVPIWYASSFNFHLLSIILLLYVMIQSIINSIKKKNLNSYLVTFAFICLLVFHSLLLLTPFSQSMYVNANIFLIIGFLSLLIMLIRVNIK
jgi:hypothetical protein